DYFTLVSQEELLEAPGLQPLRKQLLEKALVYYQQFLERRGDDPALAEEVASAQYLISRILTMTRPSAEALPALAKARAACEKLVRERPDSVEVRRYLARCHHDEGYHYVKQGGRWDEARRSFEQARALQEELLREFPGGSRIRADLAQTYSSLGAVEEMTHRQAEARKWFAQAVAAYQALLRDDPANLPPPPSPPPPPPPHRPPPPRGRAARGRKPSRPGTASWSSTRPVSRSRVSAPCCTTGWAFSCSAWDRRRTRSSRCGRRRNSSGSRPANSRSSPAVAGTW